MTRASSVQRRELLLEAGTELFAHRPYDDVAMEDVADRAGVAHGLAFHYFKNKRGFYRAVVERSVALSAEHWMSNTEPDPGRWLRKELDLFLDSVQQTDQIFLMVIRNSLGADVGDILTSRREAAAERVHAKLAPQRSSPLLRSAIIAWVAFAQELASQWLETRGMARTRVHALMIANLNATLRKVAEIDPSARFDPEAFAQDVEPTPRRVPSSARAS